MAEETKKDGPLFPDLNAECDDNGLSEIESLCLNCYQQGVTRLLLTKIPFFREIILSSFSCEHCGYSDRGVQSGSRIEEKGVCYTLTVNNLQDLNRQVIKSDYGTFQLPELDFEQAPSKHGEITTVEGLLDAVVYGLRANQSQRMQADPENAVKIDEFIEKLLKLKLVEKPFKIVIDDPTGNSFIENPLAPNKDPMLSVVHYVRTHQQDVDIGCAVDDDEEDADDAVDENTASTEDQPKPNLKDEVLTFPTNCPSCCAPCQTNMKMIDIPFFKEVVIMATACDVCGKRENEVKSGSGIEEKGKRITLHLTDISDLNRDILKSDTCAVLIPELELELVEGTLGGRFTTIEGLLTEIKEQLTDKNPFIVGDSSTDSTRSKVLDFCTRLSQVASGERLNVHIILDDPAGNSYMQNVYAPDPDPEMTIEFYERSYEQNEILGLNDMKTENYTNDDS